MYYVCITRKGTNGVSTTGVTANFVCFFDRGTFWALPLTCFYLPRSARACLFPQSVKLHSFRSGPISVDRICPQPMHDSFSKNKKHRNNKQRTTTTLNYIHEQTIMYIYIYVYLFLSLSLYIYIYIYIYICLFHTHIKARLFQSDRRMHDHVAREWTAKYAM